MHAKNLIPDGAAFDLRELARNYESWPAATPEQQRTLASALRSDALRLIKRKKGKRADEGLAEVESLLSTVEFAEHVVRIAREIILARRIAAAKLQAQGKRTEAGA